MPDLAPANKKEDLAPAKSALVRLRPRSEFARNVLTLMAGTGVAQILPTLASPLIARLFSEGSFAIFTLFTRIASPLGIIATGRYELAIMLPEEDEDAINIFALGALLSFSFSILFFLIAWAFNSQICTLLDSREIGPWLYGVPVLLMTNGLYQCYNYWFNRKQLYKRLARNRVTRSTITVASKVGLGFQSAIAGGLILGEIIGQGVATLMFMFRSLKEDREQLEQINPQRIRAVAHRYRDFPKYSVPADLVNALSQAMPTFVLNASFGSLVLGRFGFTQLMLGAPIAVIASAFADVFKQRASVAFNETGNCVALWKSTAIRLTLISIPLFAVLYLAAPWLVPIVFGAKWAAAVPYVRALTPCYFFAFIASPLSRTLFVAERQSADLFWQLSLFAVLFAALQYGVRLHDPVTTLSLFAISYACMYMIYLWMSYHYSKGRPGSK